VLHLDWHPLNLLVDEAEHAITGIVDWDNARRGHPSLDLARTRAMLTFEPGLATLPTELRTRLADFLAGWTDGYGPADVPLASQRWAARVMLADLAPRYASTPDHLDPLRTWIASMEG
jgi:aminoglycoside phosphotransferase (APT) family kinase protein